MDDIPENYVTPLRTSLRNWEYWSGSGAPGRWPKLEKTASRTIAMTTHRTMFLVRSFNRGLLAAHQLQAVQGLGHRLCGSVSHYT